MGSKAQALRKYWEKV